MKIAMGADAAGFELKNAVKKMIEDAGHEILDFGSMDAEHAISYVEAADKVAQAVSAGEVERGILVCSTGMGMSIIANKHRGVYASVVESQWAAHECRVINNANVLCFGSRILGQDMAMDIVKTFLSTGWREGLPDFLFDYLGQLSKDVETFEASAF